jgi:anti-sigma regulatory factor (Ser/Thr protein kinase)
VAIKDTRSFRACLANALEAAGFVGSVLAGMPPRLVMRVELVVEELFVNTVAHGYGGDSDAAVDVTVRVDDGRIALIFEDTAPPFDPFATIEVPDSDATIEERGVGKLGVFLITQFAARCDYARDGDRNRVTVELPVA